MPEADAAEGMAQNRQSSVPVEAAEADASTSRLGETSSGALSVSAAAKLILTMARSAALMPIDFVACSVTGVTAGHSSVACDVWLEREGVAGGVVQCVTPLFVVGDGAGNPNSGGATYAGVPGIMGSGGGSLDRPMSSAGGGCLVFHAGGHEMREGIGKGEPGDFAGAGGSPYCQT